MEKGPGPMSSSADEGSPSDPRTRRAIEDDFAADVWLQIAKSPVTAFGLLPHSGMMISNTSTMPDPIGIEFLQNAVSCVGIVFRVGVIKLRSASTPDGKVWRAAGIVAVVQGQPHSRLRYGQPNPAFDLTWNIRFLSGV